MVRCRQVKDLGLLVAENMDNINLAAGTNTTVAGNFTVTGSIHSC
jgi:hypothetical protein